VILAVFVLVVVAAVSIFWTALSVGIAPLPTTRRVRSAMFELLPNEATGEVHELGAGWGALAFPLADRYPSSVVVAWEASPVPFAFCWLRQRLRPRPNLVLRLGDFLSADLRRAGIVTCYLFPKGMERLDAKLGEELPAGAVVISNTFALRRRTPSASIVVADLYRTHVFRYDWVTGPLGGGVDTTQLGVLRRL